MARDGCKPYKTFQSSSENTIFLTGISDRQPHGAPCMPPVFLEELLRGPTNSEISELQPWELLHMQVIKLRLEEEIFVKAMGEAIGSKMREYINPRSTNSLHPRSPLGLADSSIGIEP